MPWRDVDESSAGRVVHKSVTGEQLARAFAEWMPVLELAEMTAIEAANDLITVPTALLGDRRQQHRRDNEIFLRVMDQRIAESRIVGHGQIRRQGPRSRRP